MPSPQAIAIILSSADRATLEGWTRRRKTAQSLALRARIVLACAAPGAPNVGVAKIMGVSRPTVATWRRRFAERGPAGLLDKPRSGRPRSITDEQVESSGQLSPHWRPSRRMQRSGALDLWPRSWG